MQQLSRSGIAKYVVLLLSIPAAAGADTFPPTIDLGALDGVIGFTMNGVDLGDGAGFGVGSAGDLNGDEIEDLVVGAWRADPSGTHSGQAYVIFGGESIPAVIELSELDGELGFALDGVEPGDNAGVAVEGVGDFNGDGYDDLIVGAPMARDVVEIPAVGESYVVFGRPTFPAVVKLIELDGTDGFTLVGTELNDQAGAAAAAGDVNGDGYADVAAPLHSGSQICIYNAIVRKVFVAVGLTGLWEQGILAVPHGRWPGRMAIAGRTARFSAASSHRFAARTRRRCE